MPVTPTLLTSCAVALLVLFRLLAPHPAAAAWLKAPGTLKPGMERVEYDPASHRFDPKHNLDTVLIRYVFKPAQAADFKKFLATIPSCAAGMKKRGACTSFVMSVDFNGVLRLRFTPRDCLNSKGASVCVPTGMTDDSWSTMQDDAPEYHIYRELVLVPERGDAQPSKPAMVRP